ncbi:MAG: transcriptional regulator MntR [Candidatus Methylacidiphilales bacterium]|nr:transcriptional regulator MntR [Candidatus Methylacidiphilales bacterium]
MMTTPAAAAQSTQRRRSAHDRAGVTESAEDYLERIYELIESKGYARVSDIAEALSLSRPSVSIMVQRLDKLGYLLYEKYRGLTLTPEGVRVAQAIRRRHAILTEFFQLLELPSDIVERDVEGVEHHVSPELLQRLESLVEHCRTNPGPLREMLGDLSLNGDSASSPDAAAGESGK